MKEIYDLAIVIMYPDGYIDKVPIKKDQDNHVAYFFDRLKESPRFANLVREKHFKFNWVSEYNIYEILKFLVKNNVMVMINVDIALINMSPEAKVNSRFEICAVDNYLEHACVNYLKDTVNFLDDNRYVVYKLYDDMLDEIDDYSDLLDSKEEEKKL